MCPKLLFWRFSHMSKGTEFPFRAPITKMLGQQDCSGGRYCPLCCAVPDRALLCRAEVHRLLSTPKRNRVEGGICEHGYHTHALGRFPSERSSRRLARLGWSRRDLSLGKPVRPKMGSTAEVVVGVRRSGKTFRLHQEMLRLMESGVPVDRICYLSFDDDRLRPCEDGLVGRVLEVFFEEHPRARRPAGTGQGAARSPASTA